MGGRREQGGAVSETLRLRELEALLRDINPFEWETADFNEDGNLDLLFATRPKNPTVLIGRAGTRRRSYCEASANSRGEPVHITPLGSRGTDDFQLSLSSLGIPAGTTWFFQRCYSDTAGPARQFNFSSALALLLRP